MLENLLLTTMLLTATVAALSRDSKKLVLYRVALILSLMLHLLHWQVG